MVISRDQISFPSKQSERGDGAHRHEQHQLFQGMLQHWDNWEIHTYPKTGEIHPQLRPGVR